jgi:hypothetical protein
MKALLLRQLIGGKKQLYSYEESNFMCFFACNKGEIPQQLIHKYYWKTSTAIAENNQFRNQLFLLLGGSDCLKADDFEDIEYESDGVISIFTKYYKCAGKEIRITEQLQKMNRKKFEAGIFVGA